MDIDAIGKHVHSLLAFKEKVEEMIAGSDTNVAKATDQLDELLRFKSTIEAAMPDIGKMVTDISAAVDDIAKVKQDLAPVLEWIAAHQKQHDETQAAADLKHAADDPGPDKPIDPHPVAVETTAGPIEGRSESEQARG